MKIVKNENEIQWWVQKLLVKIEENQRNKTSMLQVEITTKQSKSMIINSDQNRRLEVVEMKNHKRKL